MQTLEENSEFFGVSKLKLMQNAGKNSAKAIKKIMIKKRAREKEVLVIAGQGNNGGDGFVIASCLNCNVYFVGDKKKLKKEALVNYKKLKKSKFIDAKDLNSCLSNAKIVVDALLGTGIKGKVKENYARVIRKVNKANVYKISIDIPSGLDANKGKGSLHIKPNLLLELHDNKFGLKHLKKFGSKKLVKKVIDINIPEKAINGVGPGELKLIIKQRKPNSHKGNYGKILIIAGSEEYAGAPVLVAKALVALRTGTDLVTIAAPSNVGWIIHKYLPDLIVKKFPCKFLGKEHVKDVLKLVKNNDVIVFGPGFGRNSDEFVNGIIDKLVKMKKPMVLDADALKAIDKNNLRKLKNTILTPHSKEFELMFGKKLPKKLNEKIKTVKMFAKNNVILLKGNPDIIAYKNQIKLNYTGNPAMTVGGTGDVLAGLCAGFLAQSKYVDGNTIKYDVFNSACSAAFVDGLAGDKVEKVVGNGLIASDLFKEIPKVIVKYTN